MKTRIKAASLASLIAILSTPLLADSGKEKSEALEREIAALQARVAALEAQQTFTSFMPNVAERFHVMHRAADAGDWAVASHELSEMQRLTQLSDTINPDQGKLMQAMLAPSFEALASAIENTDDEKFDEALVQTIDSCNACHAATGSPFIQVTLDARDSLSLRHPHKFAQQAAAAGHGHGASSGTMGGMMSGQQDHDDTGKPAHDDAPEAAHDDTGKAAHDD